MTHEELNELLSRSNAEIDKGNFAEAENSARKIVTETENSSEFREIHCRALLVLSTSLWRRGMTNEAIPFSEKALIIANQLDNKELQAKTLGNIGIEFMNLSDNSSALTHFHKALAIYEQISNKSGRAKILANIGMVYKALSDFSLALEYYQKALFIEEELGNKSGIASSFLHIGIVYKYLSNYPSALEFYQKSLAIWEEIGNKSGIASSLNNIGNVYVQLSDCTHALEYLHKAMAKFEEFGDKAGVASSIGNIGIIYIHLSDYQNALGYMLKAMAKFEELGNKSGMSSMIGNIGNIYATPEFEGYAPAKSEEYLIQAVAIDEEIGFKENLYWQHLHLAELYEKQERWQDFAVHYKKYHELEKEVLSEEAKKSADRFEMQMLAKEKEIERLKNVELAEANEALEKLNVEKNEFLGIAAHDLKNPLAAITTSIGILERYGSRMEPNEVAEKYSEIKRTSKRMLDIITNLLDINAIERGAITFKPELFNLSETVQEVVDSNRQRAEEKRISLFFDLVPEPTEITADKQITSQIIDNLVSNAVKYSPQNRNVWVNLESDEKSVKISVRDEGPGLSPEDMEKLFGIFQRLSSKPTGGEHSTGLGLSIVKKLVEAMNGKVWCESELGKGAIFIVELPKTASNSLFLPAEIFTKY